MRPSEGRVTGSIPVGGTNPLYKVMLIPSNIIYHKKSKILELVYSEGSYLLPAEYLRVMSPSAEVQGHSPEERCLQVGKKGIAIVGIEPIGQYAIQLVFSDGHDSGYYDWNYLHDLASHLEPYWQQYLAELERAGASRDPDDPNNQPFMKKPIRACHH